MISPEDLKLLQLAAKAAGIYENICWQNSSNSPLLFKSSFKHIQKYGSDTDHGERWNPFTDDATAVRLLVQLRLPLDYSSHSWGELDPATTCGKYWDSGESCYRPFRVRHKNDPYAATRRAIVLAAAEIGKNIK